MIGVVMPVWLNDCPPLWESTRRAVGTLRPALDSLAAHLFLVPNRLHTNDPAALERDLGDLSGLPTTCLPIDGARSVAASWNQGIRAAGGIGCDRFLITANDCYWHPGAIATLDVFGRDPANDNVLAWCGCAAYDGTVPAAPVDACDFTGVMIRPETIARMGWFDEHFRPAYFEDNDAYTRITLAGGECRLVPAARFDTSPSLTVRSDPEAAHHVTHWWGHNCGRYAAKWGTRDVPRDRADCLARCWPHPWNDETLPVTFWDRG